MHPGTSLKIVFILVYGDATTGSGTKMDWATKNLKIRNSCNLPIALFSIRLPRNPLWFFTLTVTGGNPVQIIFTTT
jgi:hypothetical protein